MNKKSKPKDTKGTENLEQKVTPREIVEENSAKEAKQPAKGY